MISTPTVCQHAMPHGPDIAPGNGLPLIRRLLDIFRSSIPATIECTITTHVPFGQLCLIPFLFSSPVFFCCVVNFWLVVFSYSQLELESLSEFLLLFVILRTFFAILFVKLTCFLSRIVLTVFQNWILIVSLNKYYLISVYIVYLR